MLGHRLCVLWVHARGQVVIRRENRGSRIHRSARTRAGIDHLLPAGAVVVPPRRISDFRVNGAILRLAAEFLRREFRSLGQEVAHAFALADHLEQSVGPVDIAPLQAEAQILIRDVALLLTLHHPAAQPAELVHVHTCAIELGVHPGDLLRVRGTNRPARARPSLVLGLVNHLPLIRTRGDDLHVAMVHAARAALMAPVVETLAQAVGLPLLRFDFLGPYVRRVVSNRERPHAL